MLAHKTPFTAAANDILIFFFFFFFFFCEGNKSWRFMWNRLLGRRFTWKVKTYFLWKIKKIECRLLQSFLGALRINTHSNTHSFTGISVTRHRKALSQFYRLAIIHLRDIYRRGFSKQELIYGLHVIPGIHIVVQYLKRQANFVADGILFLLLFFFFFFFCCCCLGFFVVVFFFFFLFVFFCFFFFFFFFFCCCCCFLFFFCFFFFVFFFCFFFLFFFFVFLFCKENKFGISCESSAQAANSHAMPRYILKNK